MRYLFSVLLFASALLAGNPIEPTKSNPLLVPEMIGIGNAVSYAQIYELNANMLGGYVAPCDERCNVYVEIEGPSTPDAQFGPITSASDPLASVIYGNGNIDWSISFHNDTVESDDGDCAPVLGICTEVSSCYITGTFILVLDPGWKAKATKSGSPFWSKSWHNTGEQGSSWSIDTIDFEDGCGEFLQYLIEITDPTGTSVGVTKVTFKCITCADPPN